LGYKGFGITKKAYNFYIKSNKTCMSTQIRSINDFYPEGYLANLSDNYFHDLANEKSQCAIAEIIDQHQDRPYRYRVDAKRDNYIPCPHCMPDEF